MAAKKNKIKAQKSTHILSLITYFLTALICLGIFFDGYFFEQQSLTVNILTAGFFLIILVNFYKNNTEIYLNKHIILLAVAFTIINILGLFFASHVRDALQNVVILINALMILFLAMQSMQDEKNIYTFFKGIYGVVAIIAFLAIIGYLTGYNIFNFYPNNGSRLFASLGYPNTMAIVFIIAFFIGILLLDKKYYFDFTNAILFITFLKTGSRGALVILPILVVVYFLRLPKGEKITGLIHILLLIVPASIVYFTAFNANITNIVATQSIKALVALVLLLAFYFFINKINIENIKYQKIIATILLASIIVGIFAFVVIEKDNLSKHPLVKRIETLASFEDDSSMYSRVIFIQDALKITKDNLLLGTGAGGWNAEYRKYRTYLYYTSQVHNHYVQVLVENGIFGFLLFLSLWGFLFYYLHLKYNRAENKKLYLLAFIIAIAFALHSFMDFDFTYPVVYYLWWILLALSIPKDKLVNVKLNQAKTKYVLITLVTIIFILNSSLWLGSAQGKAGINYMQQQNLTKAIDKLESSTILDPVNPTYLVNLSQLYYAKGESEKGLKTLDKAIKYNPTNFEWYIVKTRMLVNQGEYEKGYQAALKAIEQAPFEEVVYYDTARFFLEKNDDKALAYTRKILDVAEREGEEIEENEYRDWWRRGNRLNESPKIAFIKALFYDKTGGYDLAKENYYLTMNDKNLKDVAKNKLQKLYGNVSNIIVNGDFSKGNLGWSNCGFEGLERKIIEKDNTSWLNISKEKRKTRWWGICQSIYEFTPNQKYELSFDAYSKKTNGKIYFLIHQVDKDNHIPHIIKFMDIDNKSKGYHFIFKTVNVKEKEFLRLYVAVPDEEEAQDVFISNIKLKKIN